MSGLGVGDEQASPLRLQMLLDYLGGLLGGGGERAGVVGRVAHVVVAGGLLQSSSALSQPTAYASVRQQAAATAPLRCLWLGGGKKGCALLLLSMNMVLGQLAATVPVDGVPAHACPRCRPLAANYPSPFIPGTWTCR